MNWRAVLVIGALGVVVSQQGVMAAETLWTEVAVRVYQTAVLRGPDLHEVLKVAARTLESANVEIIWRECASGARDSAAVCGTPIERELAIRLVRSPANYVYSSSMPLGDAMIDTRRRAGVLGTLYVDRVQWLARASDVDMTTLLGRAIAHELGHLLLASSAHGAHGLMRPVWSQDELRRGWPRDWAFTRLDVAAIRQRGVGTRTRWKSGLEVRESR